MSTRRWAGGYCQPPAAGWTRGIAWRLMAVVALALAMLPLGPASALAAPPDWDLSVGGHFYSQTGNGTDTGFSVTNADGVALWTAYGKLGGPESLGYPITHRFKLGDRTVQIFQRAALESPGRYDEPGSKAVRVMPALDVLAELGLEDWLQTRRAVPARIDPKELGLTGAYSVEQEVTARQALLATRPALRSVYFGAEDPIARWGLPTSRVLETDSAFVIRTEAAVLQEWKVDVPWARAGDVTVALVGDLLREANIVRDEAAWTPLPAPEPYRPPAPRDGPQADANWVGLPGERWIDVNLSTQRVHAMVGNQVVYTAPATTGKRGWATPTGTFRIFSRVYNETMDSATLGIPRNSPEGYYLTNIYFTQYFANGGYALHSNYWQPDSAFGNYPTSHGCVGMRYNDAKFFWDFATYGTRVNVHY